MGVCMPKELLAEGSGLMGTATELIDDFNHDIEMLTKNRVSIINPWGYFLRRDRHKLESDISKHQIKYSKYVTNYNKFLANVKQHDASLHNLKHQSDLVSLLYNQVNVLQSNIKQTAQLSFFIYFNSFILLVAVLAFITQLMS